MRGVYNNLLWFGVTVLLVSSGYAMNPLEDTTSFLAPGQELSAEFWESLAQASLTPSLEEKLYPSPSSTPNIQNWIAFLRLEDPSFSEFSTDQQNYFASSLIASWYTLKITALRKQEREQKKDIMKILDQRRTPPAKLQELVLCDGQRPKKPKPHEKFTTRLYVGKKAKK